MLERSSSNNLEIDEKVVFDSINRDTFDEQVCCMKPTGKTYTCLLCKDGQFASKCVVERLIKLSTSSRMFLCSVDLLGSVFTIKFKHIRQKWWFSTFRTFKQVLSHPCKIYKWNWTYLGIKYKWLLEVFSLLSYKRCIFSHFVFRTSLKMSFWDSIIMILYIFTFWLKMFFWSLKGITENEQNQMLTSVLINQGYWEIYVFIDYLESESVFKPIFAQDSDLHKVHWITTLFCGSFTDVKHSQYKKHENWTEHWHPIFISQ